MFLEHGRERHDLCFICFDLHRDRPVRKYLDPVRERAVEVGVNCRNAMTAISERADKELSDRGFPCASLARRHGDDRHLTFLSTMLHWFTGTYVALKKCKLEMVFLC